MSLKDSIPLNENKPINFNKRTVKKQILQIPIYSDYRANRYDTDDKIKLHLWDSNGNSYDIEIDK